MIIYDDDGIGHDVIPRKAVDEIKSEFIKQYPKNYAGDLELGGKGCVFSLNQILKIIDEKVKEYNASNVRECNTCKHSNNGNTNSTETCHECMWDSKYEKVKEHKE